MIQKTKGEKIKEIRLQMGISLDKLSSMTGISKGFLSGFENNKSDISGEYLLKIVDVLDVSMDYIFRPDSKYPKKHTKEPVEIPLELSDLAEENGLTYKETLTLLEIDNSIMARRSTKSTKVKTKEYWKDLCEGVRDFMPIVGFGLYQINKSLKSFVRGM